MEFDYATLAKDLAQTLSDAQTYTQQLRDERDALRARVAQLEALVERCLSLMGDVGFDEQVGEIEAALAATPADAGRRWEAMREVCEAARLVINGKANQLALLDRLLALARLDAEGR